MADYDPMSTSENVRICTYDNFGLVLVFWFSSGESGDPVSAVNASTLRLFCSSNCCSGTHNIVFYHHMFPPTIARDSNVGQRKYWLPAKKSQSQ